MRSSLMRYSILFGDDEVVVLLAALHEQVFARDQVRVGHRAHRVGQLLLVERHAVDNRPARLYSVALVIPISLAN